MYFTSGSDRAFEQLMQTRPGADHFDSGEAGAPEDCGTCRFYRPHWKYQFCCLCSSSPKKRSDPKEIPAKSRFFRKPHKKREGAACVLPKTKQRVVMHPPFRHSSVEFEWPRQSRLR